jgi:hypothetical protein
MRARGYEPFGEQTRGSLGRSESREIALELEGGKCYAILAVGDNGVRDLDLALVSSRNEVIDRDIEADARPVVRVCPRGSGAFRMQVRMADGEGNFVYAAYRWPRGTRGPFGLSGLIYVRLAETIALLNVEGYEPDPNVDPGRGTLRRSSDNAHHDVTLTQGQCYAIVVVGEQGLNNLDVQVARSGTALAADASRTAFPNVRVCPTETGPHRVTVQAADGHGGYFYQVLKRGS